MPEPLVKRASDAAGRNRLRREARVLQRARHPGVVAVLAWHDRPDDAELSLARVNGPTLADAPPADPTAAASVVAAVARTIADLHDLGIAHRRVGAEHVLLASARHPVLCGFGDATDQATTADRRADVAALIDLVELVAVSVDTTAGRSARRRARRLRRVPVELRRAAAPVTAGALAARLGRVSGPATTRRPNVARPTGVRPGARPLPILRRFAALALVPAVVAGALVVRARPVERPSRAAAGEAATGEAAAGTGPGSVGPNRPSGTASSTRSSTAGPSSTTVPAPIDPGAAPTPRVVAGGSTYEAGDPGDRIVVADWTCTGEPSALLLRPSTGDLWLFASLPAPDEAVVAQHVANVVGARDIVVDGIDAACPPLVVTDERGTRHEVEER